MSKRGQLHGHASNTIADKWYPETHETAAPPPANDDLRVMAKQWREEHLGHFLNSRELGEDGEDKLFDAKLYVLLAQVAARVRYETAKKFRQNVLDRATVPIESDLRRWMDSEWDELQKAVGE